MMPDNFVQQPENTQNYNRYAYVLNNPLMYTDPSGELIFLAAVAIGILVSAATYTITCLTSGQNFSWGGLATATFIGAASAAVTFGIGTAAGNLFTNFFSKAAFQAIAHGTFQGAMTGIQGGNFWNGFAAGALSSIASSAFSGGQSMTQTGSDGVGIPGTGFNSIGDNLGDAGMIAFGTVAGGAGAALTGGNFWQGAVTGLVVSGLNHAMHKMSQRQDLIGRLKAAGYNDPSAYANLSDSELAGFAQKVLPELYAEAKNPTFETANIDDEGQTLGQKLEYKSGKVSFKFTGKILLGKSTFSSYLKLASTMGHELTHAVNYLNGNMAIWYAKGGESYRKAMSEYSSYNWEDNVGGDSNCKATDSYRLQISNFKF